MRVMHLAVPIAVVGLTILLFFQPMEWMVSAWLGDPYYGHGFLIPVVALALAWRLRRKLAATPSQGSLWGLVLVGLAVLATVVAVYRQAFFAACLALPLLVAAVALYLKGWAALRMLLFPIGYLALMIPLPFVAPLALQLELVASDISATVARLVGTPAEATGAAVNVPGASYVVGVACSGMNSLMALIAIGLLLAYLVDGWSWARVALFASLGPIALLANVLRISSLLVVANHFGGGAGLTYHDTLAGPLFWALALGLLVYACRLLRCRLTHVVWA